MSATDRPVHARPDLMPSSVRLPPQAAVVCAVVLVISPLPILAAVNLRQARQALDQKYAEELSSIERKCGDLGLADQQRMTRQWRIQRKPDRQYFFQVPRLDPTDPGPDTKGGVRQWYQAFSQRRAAQAKRLFQLSLQAVDQDRPVAAYRLLFEVLRENPEHQEARRILGFQQRDGRWQTRFAAEMSKAGKIWHERFGWLPAGHVVRYEAGQRWYRGRWFSQEEEERVRGRIENGWRVETDHYVITTNHSLEAGVQFGRQLEHLYAVWQQLFVTYYASDVILQRRLRGEMVSLIPRRKYKVVFFRNRDEYIRELQPIQPQIGMTLGLYLGQKRAAYFFAGSDRAEATLFHEATHQLFHETRIAGRKPRDDVGADSNFWIIEGIAMYMESLRSHAGYWTLGGVDTPRLQFARHQALSAGFYLPLAQLASLDRQRLQSDKRIRVLYSQSAGLAQFLMVGQQGRYRDSLIDYLRVVYQGRDDPHTLAELTGKLYTELDAEYRVFLGVRDDDLVGLAATDELTRLLLGRTEVTDVGVSRLEQALHLKDLSLEGTQITDASLETVARLADLEELDLSGTRISDAGLKHLASLNHLKILLLAGTPITDEGLTHLQDLTRLERLDVTGTQVSDEALRQLRQRLPTLRDTGPDGGDG